MKHHITVLCRPFRYVQNQSKCMWHSLCLMAWTYHSSPASRDTSPRTSFFSLGTQQHSLSVLCVLPQACAQWPIHHSRLLFAFPKVPYCLCLSSGTTGKPGILFLIHFNGVSIQHQWTCLCYSFLNSVTTVMGPILLLPFMILKSY